MRKSKATVYDKDAYFDPTEHYYEKVLNAQQHPLVNFFFGLSLDRVLARYSHMYPGLDRNVLEEVLRTPPEHFRWSGADLFYATREDGNRKMIVIETNSCPSGQKSWPFSDAEDRNGYLDLVQRTVVPAVKQAGERGLLIEESEAVCAVLYDKNPMETHGYAKTLANELGENVHCVEWKQSDPNPPARWRPGNLVLEILSDANKWIPVKVAFRYMTQRPWTRIPVVGSSSRRTLVINPIVACLAGGRNKLVAAKAYDLFNAKHRGHGITLHYPETIHDVRKSEVPLWVESMGGNAVVKVPYGNAGQGVYTITRPEELEAFMAEDTRYDSYIVQSLVGNNAWSSTTREGMYYHVGLVPDKKNAIFVSDLRIQVSFDYRKKAWRPLAAYSRRALKPLAETLDGKQDTWSMLGTNLSVKLEGADNWTTDTSRLILLDNRDFNRLGISVDDLIEAFMQTVFATSAIDTLAQRLQQLDSGFDFDLFQSLNNDSELLGEILRESPEAQE